MTEAAIPPPPAGFIPSPGRPTGYIAHNGPYFEGPDGDETVQRAFYPLTRHTNGLGIVHGGMLSAFADTLLAKAVFRKTGKVAVTMHLSLDFLNMARVGEWVIGESRVVRATNDIVFVEGALRVGERDVLRASGIFKLMQRHA